MRGRTTAPDPKFSTGGGHTMKRDQELISPYGDNNHPLPEKAVTDKPDISPEVDADWFDPSRGYAVSFDKYRALSTRAAELENQLDSALHSVSVLEKRVATAMQPTDGATPLDDKLGRSLLDVFNEGQKAFDSGTVSPYRGNTLEHCIHAMGWVQRDLRVSLDKAQADLAAMQPTPAEMEYDDIPDTPEQRALIKAHNDEIRRKHPNLKSTYLPPAEDDIAQVVVDDCTFTFRDVSVARDFAWKAQITGFVVAEIREYSTSTAATALRAIAAATATVPCDICGPVTIEQQAHCPMKGCGVAVKRVADD